MQLMIPALVGPVERYGLRTPNHRFLESHPTASAELLVRLGSGDAIAKPDIDALEGDRVRFEDGSIEPVDAIIYATGYNLTFPFFDTDFISAPGNAISLYKRIFKPGIDDLAFIGFAQPLPTLFAFAECQARLLARYAVGQYRPPSAQDMEEILAADDRRFTGHYRDSPRHTQQVDYFVYEYEMRRHEMPRGALRAARLGPVELAGRAAANTAAADHAEVAAR